MLARVHGVLMHSSAVNLEVYGLEVTWSRLCRLCTALGPLL